MDDAAKVVIKTPKFVKVVRMPGKDAEVYYYNRYRFQPAPVEDHSVRIRERGRWKGRAIKKYRVHFISEPQLLMFQNILDREFTLIKNHTKFFRLPAEAMTLFLSICWVPRRPAILSFDQIIKLTGWKRWGPSDHAEQVKKVEALLGRLKNDGWIGGWQKLNGEVYHLFKTEFNQLAK